MHHAIRAIVGSERLFQGTGFPGLHFASVKPLPQGFTLVLVTQAMLDDVADLVGVSGGAPYPELAHLSLALERVIEDRTRAEPIAYFETHYVSEVGTEAAAVWHHGKRVFGPVRLERPTFRDPRADPTAPVCSALRRLGVRHRPGRDELDALGLSRFATMPR
jgi:hypothetical protein